jgi:hypothetical protein
MELIYDAKYEIHNDIDFNIIVSDTSLGDLECFYDKNIIAGDYIMPPKKSSSGKEKKEKKETKAHEKKEKKGSKEKKPRAKRAPKASTAKMNGTNVVIQDPSN